MEISGALLAVLDDQSVIRRILVHEFSHCFDLMYRMVSFVEGGGLGMLPLLTRTGPDDCADKDNENLCRLEEWFGGEDLAQPLLSVDDDVGSHLAQAVVDGWIGKGLPAVELSDVPVSTHEALIPPEVMEHIQQLMLRRSSGA